MHIPKVGLAVLSVFASQGSARNIPSNQRSRILPDGCVPVAPCETVPDSMDVSCTSKILKCTGPSWETPGNKSVLVPWEPDLIANVGRKAGPFTTHQIIPPKSPKSTNPTKTHDVRGEIVTRRDEDQETVYVWGPTRWTVNAKPTAAVENIVEDDDETVYVWGPTIWTVNAKPTPAVAKRDEDQETVYVFGSSRITVAPQTSEAPTQYVVEATYITGKKGHVTPTIAPKPREELGRPAIADAPKENVVIPTDAPWAINPHGGRFSLAPLINHPPTTMKQQVRRQLAIPNGTPDASSDVEEAVSDITTPLQCYEWARRGTEGATAICTFGTLNDPQTHLFPDTEFLAIGKHSEYVCQKDTKGAVTGAIACSDRCGQCDIIGSGTSDIMCKNRCGGVDKREEEKAEDEYKFVIAGTSEDGFAGFWCPPEMIMSNQTCIFAYPGQG